MGVLFVGVVVQSFPHFSQLPPTLGNQRLWGVWATLGYLLLIKSSYGDGTRVQLSKARSTSNHILTTAASLVSEAQKGVEEHVSKFESITDGDLLSQLSAKGIKAISGSHKALDEQLMQFSESCQMLRHVDGTILLKDGRDLAERAVVISVRWGLLIFLERLDSKEPGSACASLKEMWEKHGAQDSPTFAKLNVDLKTKVVQALATHGPKKGKVDKALGKTSEAPAVVPTAAATEAAAGGEEPAAKKAKTARSSSARGTAGSTSTGRGTGGRGRARGRKPAG